MGYRLRQSWAAPAAKDDVRSSVVIETDEFPFPVRFYFLCWKDDELGTTGAGYLGYAIESGPVSSDSVDGVDLDGFGPSPDQLRWLKENIGMYQVMADCAIETPWDLTVARRAYASLAKRAALRRVQGRPWSQPELDLVLELVEAYRHAGFTMDEIAVELSCDRKTLYRAVKKARAAVG